MSNEQLDPKSYCGGVAPVGGSDGYSDFKSDFDEKAKDASNARAEESLKSAPDYIKQAIAKRMQQEDS